MHHDTKTGRWWGLIFLAVPLMVGGGAVFAPKEWWLPAPAATFAADVDGLFMLITYVTGIVFLITNVLLVYTMFFTRTEGKALYTHGNNTLEIVWTAIPAAMLLFLALYQRSTWADIKQRFPDKADLEVKVIAQQFAWNVIYDTNRDGKFDETGKTGDLIMLNRLVVPRGKKVLVHLSSRDVLHSFFLPQMRLKQDAVPGMVIPVWFEATESTEEYARNHKVREQLLKNLGKLLGVEWREDQWSLLTELVYMPSPLAPKEAVKAAQAAYAAKEQEVVRKLGDTELFQQMMKAQLPNNRTAGLKEVRGWTYELACAELCGLGHTAMRGTLVVLDAAEFDAWLKEKMQ
jgi:cytochrome c oxidase subunit 2